MGLLSLFKKQITNIFINGNDSKKLDVGSGKVDYTLSRSLYASIPTQDASYSDYALGNYSIKTYIDTLSSHIATPRIASADSNFASYANSFIERNKKDIVDIAKTAMIDGVCYVWLRLEKNVAGYTKQAVPTIKLIPRENIIHIVKDATGRILELVIEWEEKWTHLATDKIENEIEQKKSRIRLTLKGQGELWEVLGDEMPPGYKKRREELPSAVATSLGSDAPFSLYVPVYAVYNNKLNFLDDGIPEVAPLLPFIRKYNSILEQIDNHLHRILEPKLKLKLNSATSFLKNSLGLREGDYKAIERGEYKPDVTQFKVAILNGKDEDASFIQQENNVQSAISVLNLIHWIIVELTMPEYLYGTALNTTNASVKEQSPVWVKKIEDRRDELNSFYYWFLQVLHDYSIITHGRDLYSDFSIETVAVEWEELQAKDDVAFMGALKTFTDAVNNLLDNGIISPETAFNTLKSYLSNPKEWNEEREEAIAHIKAKAEWENMQKGGLL